MWSFRAIHDMVENWDKYSSTQISNLVSTMNVMEREKLADAIHDKIEQTRYAYQLVSRQFNDDSVIIVNNLKKMYGITH
jgi:bifunctional pyridoxal-dependent enzyme with beta-cystathionase and maltose regulon repressor activities